MTGNPTIDAILFSTSVLSTAYISMAEFAVTTASRSRLEAMTEQDSDAARRALWLRDNNESLEAAVQIATTFMIILGAVVVMPYIREIASLLTGLSGIGWLFRPIYILAVLVLMLPVVAMYLVLGSLVAKSLGIRYADSISLRTAGTLYGMTRILRVPRLMIIFVANVILRPFRGEASFHESVASEENLMDIIEEGTKTGLVDETEHELIESIFQFSGTTAREVMIPRTDVIAVDASMAPEEIMDLVLEEGFTRMPVYEESIDNILGVIYAKDVVSLFEHKNVIILQDIIRPAYVVPETKPIAEILREFQRKRLHLAIVVDEFGGMEGIITMEDILEEIVGDIRDEYDEEEQEYEVLPDGSVLVEGMMNIADFNTSVDLTIPDSEDYDTVAGFITTVFGRIPDPGDHMTIENMDIEVLEVEEHRVRKVRILRRNGGSAERGDS